MPRRGGGARAGYSLAPTPPGGPDAAARGIYTVIDFHQDAYSKHVATPPGTIIYIGERDPLDALRNCIVVVK